MRKLTAALLAILFVAACRKPGIDAKDRTKVLIGATTVAAAGDAPIEDSIIVIAGTKIRAVGPRKDIPVPQASDRTDFTGEWIVPAKGRIEPGETANLLILRSKPHGITPAAPADVGARIIGGEWETRRGR
jgi:imidazolonepropionase-like amidohydrolase